MHRVAMTQMLDRVPDADVKRWPAIVETIAPATDGPWIVGGSVRRLLDGLPQTSDVDVGFRDAEQLAAFVARLTAAGFKQTGETPEYVGLSGKIGDATMAVQALRVTFGARPEDVIDAFDFTICQFAFDGTDLVCGDFSLYDLARKRLAIHRITYAASTVRRMLKYGRQGYRFCQGTVVAILEAVAKDPAVIHAAMEYVD